MLNDLIKKDRVIFRENINTWEEAVLTAARPLLRDGAIEQSYVDAIIECIKKYGPYIVIAPDIAIPHAQTGYGVNETSIALMKVRDPVHFGHSVEYSARIFIVLASVRVDSHIPLLKSLISWLSSDEIIEKLLEAQSIEDIKEIAYYEESKLAVK